MTNDYQPDAGSPGGLPPQLDRRRAEQPFGAPVIAVCRSCARPLTYLPERLETVQGRVFHRCPHCDACSLIRSTDVAAVETQDGPNAALWPFDRSRRLARCQRHVVAGVASDDDSHAREANRQ